jgi:hypothetical protein
MKTLMDNQIKVEFSIPGYLFSTRFNNSPYRIHRVLSNSQRKIGGISNRSFWSMIKIKHSYFFSINSIHFQYFFSDEIDRRLVRHFQMRTILTLGVPVKIIDDNS